MKKIFFVLCLFLFLSLTAGSFAQEAENELNLAQRFPTLRFKDQFNQIIPVKYYRFPQDTWFYDPLDLSYFPHEKWEKDEWSLLGRWKDGKTYNQTVYLDSPESTTVFHGTDIGQSYGFFSDFYLYADLFIVDNYPQNSGSCYLYYSNSLLTGFDESKGIMIDPEFGIYEATNSYGDSRLKVYSQYFISHNFKTIQKLDPSQYEFNQNDIEKTSIGSPSFPQAALDTQFLADYEAVTSAYRNPNASPVKAYRIEIIRENGFSEIYINGVNVASFKDKISTTNNIPDKISVSYGPRLQPGGLVVTCSIGDLYIYAK